MSGGVLTKGRPVSSSLHCALSSVAGNLWGRVAFRSFLFHFYLNDCKGRFDLSFSLCKRYLVGDAIRGPTSCPLCSWGPSQDGSRCDSDARRSGSIPWHPAGWAGMRGCAGGRVPPCPWLGGTALPAAFPCVKSTAFPPKRDDGTDGSVPAPWATLVGISAGFAIQSPSTSRGGGWRGKTPPESGNKLALRL